MKRNLMILMAVAACSASLHAQLFVNNIEGTVGGWKHTHLRLANEIDAPVLFSLDIKDPSGAIVPMMTQDGSNKPVQFTLQPPTGKQKYTEIFFNYDNYDFKKAGATDPCINRIRVDLLDPNTGKPTGENYLWNAKFCKGKYKNAFGVTFGWLRYYAIMGINKKTKKRDFNAGVRETP